MNTKYFLKKSLNNQMENADYAKNGTKTREHIVGGFPILAEHESVRRHDAECKYEYIHFNVGKSLHFKRDANWYDHVPQNIEANEKFTLLWSQQIIVNQTISAIDRLLLLLLLLCTRKIIGTYLIITERTIKNWI